MLARYNSNKNQTANIFGTYFLASMNQIIVVLLISSATCCRFLMNLTQNLLRPQRGESRSLYLRRQGSKSIPSVAKLQILKNTLGSAHANRSVTHQWHRRIVVQTLRSDYLGSTVAQRSAT